MSFIVAIDGPAGSGKGTIAKKISEKMGLVNIDSGAAYRCVGLEAIRNKIPLEEKEKIIALLDQITIEYKIEKGESVIYLNGKPVGDRIRKKDVTQMVSPISTIAEVRNKLNEIFRNCASHADVIMEGRDIGTCVFPKANVKIYLDASTEERAKRRMKQNEEKGIEISYEEVIKNIKDRDERDSNRKVAPLIKAEDAIYLDTSNMTIEQVADQIERIIKEGMKREDEKFF